MAHWHYQVMRHKPTAAHEEEYYAIHEYFPLEDGPAWTEEPVQVDASNVDELKKTLLLMLGDIEKHGVMDYE